MGAELEHRTKPLRAAGRSRAVERAVGAEHDTRGRDCSVLAGETVQLCQLPGNRIEPENRAEAVEEASCRCPAKLSVPSGQTSLGIGRAVRALKNKERGKLVSGQIDLEDRTRRRALKRTVQEQQIAQRMSPVEAAAGARAVHDRECAVLARAEIPRRRHPPVAGPSRVVP